MTSEAYSTYLSNVAALIGWPISRLTDEMYDVLNVHFNVALKRLWKLRNWTDLCPRGEARFIGNALTFPNNLSKTANWTATALTITGNQLVNPLDGRTTATKILETAASSAHSVSQAITTFSPDSGYSVFAFVRPNNRDWCYLTVTDGGGETYTVFYDLSTGTVGDATTNVTATPTMALQPNGYYLCQFQFESDSDAGNSSGTFVVGLSSDGSSTSYSGDTAKGAYVWGCNVVRTTRSDMSDFLLPFDQDGEYAIETLFNLWTSPPTAYTFPAEQPYQLSPDGAQLIASNWSTYYLNGVQQNQLYSAGNANPVYAYYRRKCPTFTGDDFDAADTYAVDEQMYFENSLGDGNFYKCLVATSAGQDPDDTPASWELLEIPQVLFQTAVYQAYADWLMSDGQQDKAQGVYQLAQGQIQDEFDREERQGGNLIPVSFSTHTSAMHRY